MAVYLFAAIDVGSRELGMTVYQIAENGTAKEIESLRQSVAAGYDTYHKGRISYEHINDICRILGEFSDVMKQYHISNYRACGTSALREAENREIVLDHIKVRTGIDVTVLSNAEQRFLCSKAIAMKEPEFDNIIQKGTILVEAGSGSTQVSLYDKDTLLTTQYLRIGSMRVQDVLDSVGAELQKAQNLIEELIDADIQTFRRLYLKDRKIQNLILTGICARILGKQFSRNGEAPKRRITAEEFYQIYNKVIYQTPYEISRSMDISIEYAYAVIPSMIIYKKILEVTEAQNLYLPGVTLSDGIVADFAINKKLITFQHDFIEDILHFTRNMAKRYKSNQKHAQSLEQSALAIFDSLKKYHGLGKRERLLLRIAAILHDCGKFVSMTDPADCAYYIIMATEIIGLSRTEQKITANVVKYYQQDFDYDVLLDEGVERRNVIAKLVAILKVAGILDRSHKQKIGEIRCTVKENTLVITTEASSDIILEQNSLAFHAEFFEEVYGLCPVLKKKKKA